MLDLEKLGSIPPQNAKILLLYFSQKNSIKQVVGGTGQKSEILAIPN